MRKPPKAYEGRRDWHDSFEMVRGSYSSKRRFNDLDFAKQRERPDFVIVPDEDLPYKNSVGLSITVSQKLIDHMSSKQATPLPFDKVLER